MTLSMTALAAWALIGAAQAQEIQIQIDQSVADQHGIDSDQVSSEISSTIDGQLNITEQLTFLDAMANAAALSTRGMGVDYASNPKRAVFGMSVGSAVNAAGVTFSRGEQELPEDGGFSFQLSAMAGINLGMGREDAALSRVRLYANGMVMDTGGDIFDAKLLNYGAHLQVQLIKDRQGAGLEWGGLALTTGYQAAGYTLELKRELPVTTEFSGQSIDWDATGTYTISSTTDSIPIELSTNLRVLIFTVYGGGGIDWNQGSASSSIGLSGPLEIGSGSQQLGTAAVTLSEEGLPDNVVPRIFVGTQANIALVKVYGHINVGLNSSFGGHTGLRFVL